MADPKIIQQLMRFGADDNGNAEAFLLLSQEKYCYTNTHGWLHYTGTHWEQDEAHLNKQIIRALITRRHVAVQQQKEPIVRCTAADEKRVTGCRNLLRIHLTDDIASFDADQHLLNVKNGVIDLRTKVVLQHSHEQKFTYCLPWTYTEAANTTDWEQFLLDSVAGGQEVVDYLRMCVGYSLTGSTSEETLFYIQGPSRSGKGTFTETLLKLFGAKLSAECDFNSFASKRDNDASNFDLAGLKQTRLIIASESNKHQSLNPAKIKALTGGNDIRCAFKHKDHFTYQPNFKIWLVSNHTINADPHDAAIWARVHVIAFPHSHVGHEDPKVKQHMKSDQNIEAVLFWAIQGAYEWYTKKTVKIVPPHCILQDTDRARKENDTLEQWFEECCTLDQTLLSSKQGAEGKDVTAHCKAWHEVYGYKAPHPKTIADFFRKKGVSYNKLVRPDSAKNMHDHIVQETDAHAKSHRICPGLSITNHGYIEVLASIKRR